MLAPAETWENGKPVRETLAADIPLAVDHLRYFAGATRSLEGRSTEIDKDTVAYHFHEPLGVGRLPLQRGSRWRPAAASISSPGPGCARPASGKLGSRRNRRARRRLGRRLLRPSLVGCPRRRVRRVACSGQNAPRQPSRASPHDSDGPRLVDTGRHIFSHSRDRRVRVSSRLGDRPPVPHK